MSAVTRAILWSTTVVGLVALAAILLGVSLDGQGAAAGKTSAPSSLTDDAGKSLAARYHLRKRTSRFFERAKRGSSSSRPSGGLLSPRRSHRRAAIAPADEQPLAARYHLRKRTSRFYKRTVG